MSSPSLLSFLDAPVVVGDPDGRAAYVNPTFEACFGVSGDVVKGQPLAALFEGGVREAVLSAVAEVCEQGTSTRFRVRHAGVGYAGMASPIVAQDARVGFVILLVENTTEHERVHALHRQLHQPMEELAGLLDDASENRGAPEKLGALLDNAHRALDRLRRASEEFAVLLTGRRADVDEECFDPASVARSVALRVQDQFAAAGVAFDVRIPGRLPNLPGEPSVLEALLLQLMRSRLAVCDDASHVSLAAGALERNGVLSVVFRTVHQGSPPIEGHSWTEPDAVLRLVNELGGDLRIRDDGTGSPATAVRLTALSE